MVKNGENFYGESGREIGKFLHFSPFFTMNTSPDKRNDFGFKVISLPHYGSNVPKSSLSGVVVSQIHRMFRANSTINGFIVNINKSLFDKLCGQGFNKGHLVSLLSKFKNKNFLDIIYKYWEIIDYKEFS